MTLETWIGALAAVAVCIYLVYALVAAERF